MMTIRVSDDEIELRGHAKDEIRCGQAYVLTISLIDYCDNVLHECPDHVLEDGYCRINRKSLRSREAAVLLDYYVHALWELSAQMPEHFRRIS